MSHNTSKRADAEHSEAYDLLSGADKDLPKPPIKFHTVHHSAKSLYYRRWKPLWQQGYQFGVVCCASITGIVFLINLISILITTQKINISHGLGTLLRGDCIRTKNSSQWLHLLINLLGTLLLGASNYCMQCLSSPTCKDIDKAHRENMWLDIGVPSLRNLRRIPWNRTLLWGILGISSLPLHWVDNSAVFATNSYQEFSAFVVGENFLTGDYYHPCVPNVLLDNSTRVLSNYTTRVHSDYTIRVHSDYTTWVPSNYIPDDKPWLCSGGPETHAPRSPVDVSAALELLQKTSKTLERLENNECIQTYSTSIVSNRGNVLLVPQYQNRENSLLAIARSQPSNFINNIDPSLWIKVGLPDQINNATNARHWAYGKQAPTYYPISYCLSTKFEDRCELQFSVTIMAIVITCNFMKLVCMICMIWKLDSRPLVTLGDAIASFLNQPDSTTDEMCLGERVHFVESRNWRSLPCQYNPKPYLWFGAASLKRWYISNMLCFLTLIIASGLLIGNLGGRDGKWSLGFGAVRSDTTLPLRQASLMTMTLLSNTPQLLLSFHYFTYNSLYTCMLLVKEWFGYAHERKGLRVTSPVGEQRSTYHLQLPYRYSIPLLVLSGTLPWLVSQSIFLVSLKAYRCTGEADPENNIVTCGYSPIAILVITVVGAAAMLLGIAMGYRRYKPGMPLVGSCSTAVSAACHPPYRDKDASVSKLKWGVVNDQGLNGQNYGVGYFSFTCFEVEKPIRGKMYAGRLRDEPVLAESASRNLIQESIRA